MNKRQLGLTALALTGAAATDGTPSVTAVAGGSSYGPLGVSTAQG